MIARTLQTDRQTDRQTDGRRHIAENQATQSRTVKTLSTFYSIYSNNEAVSRIYRRKRRPNVRPYWCPAFFCPLFSSHVWLLLSLCRTWHTQMADYHCTSFKHGSMMRLDSSAYCTAITQCRSAFWFLFSPVSV